MTALLLLYMAMCPVLDTDTPASDTMTRIVGFGSSTNFLDNARVEKYLTKLRMLSGLAGAIEPELGCAAGSYVLRWMVGALWPLQSNLSQDVESKSS